MSSTHNSGLEPQLPSQAPAEPPVSPEFFSPASFASIPTSPPPAENPVFSGVDVLVVALVTLVTLFVVEFLTVIGARVLVFPHTGIGELAQKPALALIGEFLSYIAVAAYMVMLVQGKYQRAFWREIRWNWPSTGMRALGFTAIGVLTIFLDALGSRFLPMPKSTPFDQFFAHPGDAYLMAAFAVTFGPLMEELFFRGFLYPVLARWSGPVPAVVLTALPFGLIHYLQYKSWSAVLVITMVGVVLTVVRAVSKSVGASFLVHVGYNGTLMLLAAAASDGFRHMEKLTTTVPFLR